MTQENLRMTEINIRESLQFEIQDQIQSPDQRVLKRKEPRVPQLAIDHPMDSLKKEEHLRNPPHMMMIID